MSSIINHEKNTAAIKGRVSELEEERNKQDNKCYKFDNLNFSPSKRQYTYLKKLITNSKYDSIEDAITGTRIVVGKCQGHLMTKSDATLLIKKLTGRGISKSGGFLKRDIMRSMSEEDKAIAVNKFLKENK